MLPSSPRAPRSEATTAVTATTVATAATAVNIYRLDFEDLMIAIVVAFICLVAASVVAVRSFYLRITAGGPYDVVLHFSDVSSPRKPPNVDDTSDQPPPKSDSTATTIASEGTWSNSSHITDASEGSVASAVRSTIDSPPLSVTIVPKFSPSTAMPTVTYGTHECVLLMTSTATMEQRVDINRARDILNELGVFFFEVNAAYASRTLVNRYKTTSGLSSVYPQLFVVKRLTTAVTDAERALDDAGEGEDSILFVPFPKLEEMALRGRFELPEFTPAPTPVSTSVPRATSLDDGKHLYSCQPKCRIY